MNSPEEGGSAHNTFPEMTPEVDAVVSSNLAARIILPKYLDETEALLGSAFKETDMERQLHFQGLESIAQEQIDSRYSVYMSGLRIIAAERTVAREAARQMALACDEHFDVAQWNADWNWGLDADRVSLFKYTVESRDSEELEMKPDVYLARLALERLHHSEQLAKSNLDAHDHLRSHLHPYMNDIMDFMKKGPLPVTVDDAAGNERTYMIHGAVVDAPTGSGKSGLIMKTFVAADIGKEVDGVVRRGLLVVPSLQLAEQFAGRTGQDWFRRMAPNLSVGLYTGKEKNTATDIIIVTTDLYSKDFRDGHIGDAKIAVQAFDEGHHLNEPLVQATFLRECSTTAIAFTATPAYSEPRDIHRILPYSIKHSTTLDLMAEGVLNAGLLYMVQAEVDYDQETLRKIDEEGLVLSYKELSKLADTAVEKLALEMHLPLLQEGRRGIIYRKPGNRAESADRLAELFRQHTIHGRPIRAEVLKSFKEENALSNTKILQAYGRGEIDLLLSVQWGSESLDADIDFVGIASGIGSQLKLKQIIGRGTRLSDTFPLTIYTQIIPPFIGQTYKSVSMFEIFDIPRVEQGYRLGERPSTGHISRIEHDKRQDELATSTLFTDRVQELIKKINGRVVGEVHLRYNSRDKVPADYVPFDVIYAPVADKISERWARFRLIRAKYNYCGVTENTKEGPAVRYFYEPAARTYFTDNPLPPRAGKDMKTVYRLEQEWGVPSSIMNRLIAQMERETDFKIEQRLTDTGHNRRHVTAEAEAWLAQARDKFPTAELTVNVTTASVRKRLGVGESTFAMHARNLEIKPQYMRKSDGKGFDWYITTADEAQLKDRIPVDAVEDEWTIVRMSKVSGVPQQMLRKRITDHDKELATLRRAKQKGGSIREMLHWSEVDARRIMGDAQKYKTWFESIPFATDDDWSTTRIAAAVGLDGKKGNERVFDFMTESERAAQQTKRVKMENGAIVTRPHLDSRRAEAIIKRIRSDGQPLPAHLIPYAVARRITFAPDDTPISLRKASPEAFVRFKLPLQRRAVFITWSMLAILEQREGRRPDVEPIEYDRLPVDANDTDPERLAYARQVQLRFMTAARMGFNADAFGKEKT